MAKNANLKNSIAQVVKTNGVKGITGANLQPTILQVIDKLGGGYQFGGLVQPNGTFPVDVNGNSLTDQNFAFLASTPGTYTNFGGLVVNEGEVCVFLWDGTWTKQVTGIVTGSKMADDYAKKVGIYAGLTAGISCGIADSISNGSPQQFTFRQSGGDGVNYMRRIKGKTLVWNQLISLPASFNYGGITFTNNGDGSLTLNGTANRAIDQPISDVNTISGHKYLLEFKDVDDDTPCKLVIGSTSFSPFVQLSSKVIRECTGSVAAQPIRISISNGAVLNNIRTTPQITDLTLMFGAGNEPSTVAEFEALYPGCRDYSDGKLISNDAAQVETVGFNRWDEEWESGGISSVDGSKVADLSNIRSKNFIPIFGGMTYYFKKPIGVAQRQAYYDADKSFISFVDLFLPDGGGSTFTPPANAAYILFTLVTTTYNHDVCYNISDPAKNGTYEPYWKRTIQLALTTRQDTDGNIPFPNGMQSCPVAYDEADELGGTVRVGTRAYEVGDEENANVTTDGTTTNYALAEPVPFTWAEPLPNAILVDALGTEEAVFPEHEDGTPSAPFCCDSNYSISVKNLVAALAALNANLGGE